MSPHSDSHLGVGVPPLDPNMKAGVMCRRYTLLRQLGEGTYGCVWKAIHSGTREIVAIKQLKEKVNLQGMAEGMSMAEVEALRSLKGHPNIVHLKEVIRQDDNLFYVFEYMKENLLQTIRRRPAPPSEDEIRSWMHQILKAIEHMHYKGYMHRDIKPENVLVSEGTVKLADFGLAKKMCPCPHRTKALPHQQQVEEGCSCGRFTGYVCTRWYRAPELLLCSETYSPAIDMWSVGVVMAELFRCQPLFPGGNAREQLYRICALLGAPHHETWLEGLKLAARLQFQFPAFPPSSNLSLHIPNASPEALDLILGLCTWDPRKRLTALQALQHPFFMVYQEVPYPWQTVRFSSYPGSQFGESQAFLSMMQQQQEGRRDNGKQTIVQNNHQWYLAVLQPAWCSFVQTTTCAMECNQQRWPAHGFHPCVSSYRQACINMTSAAGYVSTISLDVQVES